jgi:MSHA pilin protein MshD
MRRERGMTLIELIIAIVVMGICVASVLALLSAIAVRSASALNRTQATSVASSYLEFILAQPYNNISGYNGINRLGPLDANGAAVAGLERYRVQVFAGTATLGAGTDAVQAMRVDVTVTDPTGVATSLTGYRTDYSNIPPGGGQVLY